MFPSGLNATYASLRSVLPHCASVLLHCACTRRQEISLRLRKTADRDRSCTRNHEGQEQNKQQYFVRNKGFTQAGAAVYGIFISLCLSLLLSLASALSSPSTCSHNSSFPLLPLASSNTRHFRLSLSLSSSCLCPLLLQHLLTAHTIRLRSPSQSLPGSLIITVSTHPVFILR